MAARVIDPTVLDRVLTAAKAAGRAGVVVFDLDSTLLDNRPRQARILREFGEAAAIPLLVAAKPEHWTSWEIADAMRATGMSAGDVLAHVDAAKAFWRDRFFTSEYCAIDDMVSGATRFVDKLVATDVQIAYVTGRHEDMRKGSIASFARLGLPVPGNDVVLLMKPTFDLSDDAWKEQAYAMLRERGRVIAAFDNEPTHINGYRAAFPDAIAVHLATDHSGRPVTLLDGIVSVKTF